MVELLLPGEGDGGGGFPGGVKQQFGAVRGMVEAILLQLKQLPDFQVRDRHGLCSYCGCDI